MNTIKFASLKKSTHKIVFCIIDTIDSYPSAWIKELVKNSIDFEIGTITDQGFDVIVGYDQDLLLSEACLDYQHAVVISAGTVIADNLYFFNLIKKEIETDYFILGHVLDKKEANSELHPQCFVINLEKFKSLGCPNIGQQQLYEKHLQQCPVRSIENFHDDYTPIWVHQGSTIQEYQHKCHGWNILSLGFNAGYTIKPFTKELRSSKKYLYTDNNKEITERLSEFYLENNVASRNWINPFYTGKNLNLGPTLPGKLKNLVIPANGIDWVHFLVHHGFDKNTRVRFTDYNLTSLQFIRSLVTKWDGVDYVKFLKDFSANESEFLDMPSDIWLGIKDNLEERWQKIKTMYNWPELWKEIKSNVKFDFRFKDFLHYEGPFGRDSNYWLDESFNDSCTLISLNHVFNYHSTGVFYSLKYRVDMENYTLEKLKKIVPEAHLFFDHRSWKGFRPYNKNSLVGQVKNIETVSIKELTRPSWHYNTDWKL